MRSGSRLAMPAEFQKKSSDADFRSKTRFRRRVLIITGIGVFMSFLDATIVNVAIPSIRTGFPGTPLPTLSWVLNGYNIAFAALLVPAGRWADRLGRKRSYVFGLLLFSLASAACGGAQSIEWLIAARFMQAAGAAIVIPSSLGLLLHAYPGNGRARAVALWGAAAAVAAGTGPAAGGVLIHTFDWRSIFLVNVPVGIVAILLAVGMLAESRDRQGRSAPDAVGILLLVVALGFLALGIGQGHDWGWTSAGVDLSLTVSVVAGFLFVLRSRGRANPAFELDLLGNQMVALANLATVVFAAGFYGVVLNHVLFLTQVWGYSTQKAGFALTPAPIAAALVAVPASRLVERYGYSLVTVAGSLIFALGGAMFAFRVGLRPAFLTEWLPAAAVSGLGLGIGLPALAAAAVAPITEGRFATASGINAATRQLGAVVGIATVVALIGTPSPAESLDAFRQGWRFAFVAGLLAAPLCLFLGDLRERPGRSIGPETSGTSAAR